jgi:hypothetical protein
MHGDMNIKQITLLRFLHDCYVFKKKSDNLDLRFWKIMENACKFMSKRKVDRTVSSNKERERSFVPAGRGNHLEEWKKTIWNRCIKSVCLLYKSLGYEKFMSEFGIINQSHYKQLSKDPAGSVNTVYRKCLHNCMGNIARNPSHKNSESTPIYEDALWFLCARLEMQQTP